MDQFSDRSDAPKPVIEPGGEPFEHTKRALHLRIRQQELLAELGVLALQVGGGRVAARHWFVRQ
jgi:hypothetical protein